MKKFFTRKKIIWLVIVLLIVGGITYVWAKRGSANKPVQTALVTRQHIEQTVLTTGQVVSSTDLELSFKGSGVVQQVKVKEGDPVKSGEVLATLEQKDQLASLTSARGSLASAEAAYDKVLNGSTNEDIQISKAAQDTAQATVDNAKNSYDATAAQQEVLVKNARTAMMNSNLTAYPVQSYDLTATLSITGSYTSTEKGQYQISLHSNGASGFYYIVTGLENDSGVVSRGYPLPLGTRGLYMTFDTTGDLSPIDEWVVNLPNTKGSSYLANNNAYMAALDTQKSALVSAQNTINSAQASLDQARATLMQKQAAARPEDVAAAKASVISAQGQVASALATLENSIIRAPANGTITLVDIKIGEQAGSTKTAIVLQDLGSLHAEANVSEANIASVQTGQSVDFTLDAFGPSRHFTGTVQAINPASTVISGVVNYKVTANLENIPEIKPGMTANMTILVAKKDNVLTIPNSAVINRDSKQFVRVIDDIKNNTFHEVEVQTALQADGGLVEITSGLTEGQQIVTYIKQ